MKTGKLRKFIRDDQQPESGQECVILINGNSYGTAFWESVGYYDDFVNENYDNFDPNDITHFLPIVEIPIEN